MCDFAPRNSFDFDLALLRLKAATAGLFTPRPVIAASDTVMLLADEAAFETELAIIVSDINRNPAAPGVGGGEGEQR